MKKVRTLAWLNFIVYVLAFTASQLSQLNLIGNGNMGDISKKYDTVFTPAGITFAIWGIIYLGLFAFTIYHLRQAYQKDIHAEPNQVIQKIGYWFMINNAATFIWVFVWLNEYIGLALVMMMIQLISLIKINISINTFNPAKSLSSRLFTQIPLSIYFAWICIATIANTSVFLYSINWDGGVSGSLWTIILIAVASLLAFYIIRFKRNPYFGLVVIWAFYGIQLKRTQVDAAMYETVIQAAWFGLGFISIAVIIQFISNYYIVKKEKPAELVP
ncbi:hypothetical protein FYC62_04935 [Pedobacter aquae]|uniref:Tryptophan-rich sensory protein n=1 Tax=Pedobacter aquae TaxID=2605747 RepID=A0A5C0VHG4_9SPHI|nr:hypothetical protein [Pedobacter aquae]QEK51091.1 hypothetical protein FYC62_04935 [Pedobacter aquae]